MLFSSCIQCNLITVLNIDVCIILKYISIIQYHFWLAKYEIHFLITSRPDFCYKILQGADRVCTFLSDWCYMLMAFLYTQIENLFSQSKIRQLHTAVERGNLLEVKRLITADLSKSRDKGGRGLLHKAVLFERRFVIKYLLKEFPKMVHVEDYVSDSILSRLDLSSRGLDGCGHFQSILISFRRRALQNFRKVNQI